LAHELDIFVAIATMAIILGAALLIAIYMSYKEYKKTKKVDMVTVGSVGIAIVVTLVVAIFITWDILMNTLSNLDPIEIQAAGRAVNGFVVVNFIVLGLTFAISHGLLAKVIKR
jgi:hypothetical protein